jgi:hypothetical protein
MTLVLSTRPSNGIGHLQPCSHPGWTGAVEVRRSQKYW